MTEPESRPTVRPDAAAQAPVDAVHPGRPVAVAALRALGTDAGDRAAAALEQASSLEALRAASAGPLRALRSPLMGASSRNTRSAARIAARALDALVVDAALEMERRGDHTWLPERTRQGMFELALAAYNMLSLDTPLSCSIACATRAGSRAR
jgi:hypothetical protein